MAAELNHTIVSARDPRASAQFLADLLGLDVEPQMGYFTPVRLANRVTLDYSRSNDAIQSRHYAFLVNDDEFDAAFARIRAAGLEYFADPGYTERGQINYRYGGRGVYFRDPDGHGLEILTRAP
jgi:catechol 2,3-dioxygenase-like lactoylglutathione lyase family enzyme